MQLMTEDLYVLGPVGLVSMMIAKATGATKAFITDIVDHRLAIAKELGADEGINVQGMNATESAKLVNEKFGGPPDVAIECSGVQSSIELAIKVFKFYSKVSFCYAAVESLLVPY